MGDVVSFDRGKRPSKADLAFFPVPTQESIDRYERLASYEGWLRTARNAIFWGAIWIVALAGIGYLIGV